MALSIQVHPDAYEVTRFEDPRPFTVVKAYDGNATVSLFLQSPAMCNDLINAATEARAMLATAARDSAASRP